MAILFYYTQFVLLFMAFSSAACLAIYLVFRRRVALLAAIWFAIYFLDVALVFRTDFLVPRAEVVDLNIHAIFSPVESVILGALWIIGLALIVSEYVCKKPYFAIGLGIVFSVGSVLTYVGTPEGPSRQFLFYSVRFCAIAAIFSYVAIQYYRLTDQIMRLRLQRHQRMYLILACVAVLSVANNVIFQLLTDRETFIQSPYFFFPERNFVENAFMLICGIFALRRAAKLLVLRYTTPQLEPNDSATVYVDEKVQLFGNHHQLTPREIEVLVILLNGRTNREIARLLFLSEGTAKVHVHHILAKTSSPNREALTRQFWKESL